ncbi:MAG: deoxyribodipyrimidine photo-lyase [Candidatus Sumerlaeia bacterium]|nr:deoxyribodipyrimidine photo-lyase [Candidatus Sumerlaeia bacterium]
MNPIIWWIRRDARLADNAALYEAIKAGYQVIPLYIHAPGEEAPWEPGAAARWWQHFSLHHLKERLEDHGSRLVIRRGESLETLRRVIGETGAAGVHWNRLYEPAIVKRDTEIKRSLREEGYIARSFSGALLHEPTNITNKSGKPFQVYTPFWKHLQSLDDPPRPLPEPSSIPTPGDLPSGLALDDLKLLPRIKWDGEMRKVWVPGEGGATQAFNGFLRERITLYNDERNRPDRNGVSRLSPFLHHGDLTPRQLWHGVRDAMDAIHNSRDSRASCWSWLRQVAWREFSHHLLFHFPHTQNEPLRHEFSAFPWRKDDGALKAWQAGKTGYPIVDAGMRELWATGWMHNRVRMITASFLVKHLRIHWLEGARWFWDTLVDASLANNTMGWQWTSGCGADAAPYFRIFNPITQGEKFDETGDYTRHWIPEITLLPNRFLWKPWESSEDVLEKAGVRLGETYPYPIVDHFTERENALAGYEEVKSHKKGN